ncbi:MAG TPA: hypothetical protein VJ899_01045 [Salegentibacter sp.]|nr:hypothetical protein [Salegentibacter sp.]
MNTLPDEIEPENIRLPVLIKKYIKQNAKVIAFNINSFFNNSVDELMYIRINNLSESTLKPIMGENKTKLEAKFDLKH